MKDKLLILWLLPTSNPYPISQLPQVFGLLLHHCIPKIFFHTDNVHITVNTSHFPTIGILTAIVGEFGLRKKQQDIMEDMIAPAKKLNELFKKSNQTLLRIYRICYQSKE
ncbi:hypothetical protein ABHN05_20550 [Brevibacillus laterosporus]|uniref:hypothetical protein n=1 Tax=Brevibacillus laterosporus TaxID=1465 RepID=UPI003D241AB2